MFNSVIWQELIKETYKLKYDEFRFENQSLFLTKQNRINQDVFISPGFGDFINKDYFSNNFLNEFKNQYQDKKYAIKLLSKDKLDENLIKSGYIHEIHYNSFEDWFKNKIKSKFRNQINQTNRYLLNISISNELVDLKHFYNLHLNLRLSKFKQIPQPWVFFENLHKYFINKNNGFIISAYYKNEIISSIVCLIYENLAYYKYAASNLNFINLRPNNYILSELIKYLASIKIYKLNLGYTGGNKSYEGLRRFKLNAGANEYSRYIITNYKDGNNFIDYKKNIQNEINNTINSDYSKKDIQNLAEKYYKYFL